MLNAADPRVGGISKILLTEFQEISNKLDEESTILFQINRKVSLSPLVFSVSNQTI